LCRLHWEWHPGRGCRCSLARLFSFALCFSDLWDDTFRHSELIGEEGRLGNDLRPAALLCLALLFGSAQLFGLRNTDRQRLHLDRSSNKDHSAAGVRVILWSPHPADKT
jgi:hypothetical protein